MKLKCIVCKECGDDEVLPVDQEISDLKCPCGGNFTIKEVKATIGLRWSDFYDIMQSAGMDKKYSRFTSRLQKLLQTEFPDIKIKIEWLD